jgi:hypothetical protein
MVVRFVAATEWNQCTHEQSNAFIVTLKPEQGP